MTRTERTYYAVLASWNVWQFSISPMYALFLASRGLDLFQVNLVLATFMISVFVLDVPTGAVADLFGRKLSFVLACFTRMLAFGLYAFAQSFRDCLVAEMIDALGFTLASGALDAWAVDGVRAEGDHRPTDRMFARGQVLSRAVMVAAGVGSGYLADRNIVYPWFAAAAGFGATGVLALSTMREARFARPRLRSLHRSLGRKIAVGFGEVRRVPVLLGLSLLTFLTGFGILTLSMTWPPHLKELSGAGFWLLGWVWALLSLAVLAGSAFAARFGARIDRPRLLFAAQIGRFGGLLLAALSPRFLPALGGLLVEEAQTGAAGPIVDGWMNDHIDPERRATVLSVKSMFFTLGGSLGLVVFGLVAEHAGIPAAWLGCAGVFALAAPGYLWVGRLSARAAGAGRARELATAGR